MRFFYVLVFVGVLVAGPFYVLGQSPADIAQMASLLQSLQELLSNLMHQVSDSVSLVTAAPFQTDVTRDGVNNEADWEFLRARWFTQDIIADINGDGIVNSIDFGLLNRNWNKTTQ